MRSRSLAPAAAVCLLCSSTAYGQSSAPATALEPVAIGAAGAVGLMGNVGAVRFSAPIAPKWGVDLTVGRVDGYGSATSSGLEGPSVAAQARYHWHGRRKSGASGYWLFGPMVQGLTKRTLIVFPGNRRTVLVDETASFTLQVGYGWDWLLKNGARFGFEFNTGGGEGPNPYVNAFVVWGKPR